MEAFQSSNGADSLLTLLLSVGIESGVGKRKNTPVNEFGVTQLL